MEPVRCFRSRVVAGAMRGTDFAEESAVLTPPVCGYGSVVISSALPLLFLDVDGPLIPFGATRHQLPDGYPTYETGLRSPSADANPLITRIDPAHGPRLMALPCELVWATTWMADANECIAPWLRLPELPVMLWPETPDEPGSEVSEEAEEDERRGLHWKTRLVLRQATGRAFAWVDDEITDVDRAWVEAHHPEPALLRRIDPARGMTDADFAVLGAWLRLHAGS